MKQNIFKGLGIALVTPFASDGSVDYDVLKNLLDYQLKNGADFFCILATTGETPTLTKDEKQKIKELVVEKVGDKVPILIETLILIQKVSTMFKHIKQCQGQALRHAYRYFLLILFVNDIWLDTH